MISSEIRVWEERGTFAIHIFKLHDWIETSWVEIQTQTTLSQFIIQQLLFQIRILSMTIQIRNEYKFITNSSLEKLELYWSSHINTLSLQYSNELIITSHISEIGKWKRKGKLQCFNN